MPEHIFDVEANKSDHYHVDTSVDGPRPHHLGVSIPATRVSSSYVEIRPQAPLNGLPIVETIDTVDAVAFPEASGKGVFHRPTYSIKFLQESGGLVQRYQYAPGRSVDLKRVFNQFSGFDDPGDPNYAKLREFLNSRFGRIEMSERGLALVDASRRILAAMTPQFDFRMNAQVLPGPLETFGEWVEGGAYPYRTNLVRPPYLFEAIMGSVKFEYPEAATRPPSDGFVEEQLQRPEMGRFILGIKFASRDFSDLHSRMTRLLKAREISQQTLFEIVEPTSRFDWKFQQ